MAVDGEVRQLVEVKLSVSVDFIRLFRISKQLSRNAFAAITRAAGGAFGCRITCASVSNASTVNLRAYDRISTNLGLLGIYLLRVLPAIKILLTGFC